MTLTKEKPNFRIIENYHEEIDMDGFEKDYLNPSMSVDDIRKKHDIGMHKYTKYAKEVRDKFGLEKKPRIHLGLIELPTLNGDLVEDMRYIKQHRSGRYTIIKVIGDERYYCGSFTNKDDARRVRDYLNRCNWDVDEIKRMDELYPYKYRKDALERAKKLYPEWKQLYLNSELTNKEISEKMDIPSGVYRHLRRMVREEYGLKYRPHVSKRGNYD